MSCYLIKTIKRRVHCMLWTEKELPVKNIWSNWINLQQQIRSKTNLNLVNPLKYLWDLRLVSWSFQWIKIKIWLIVNTSTTDIWKFLKICREFANLDCWSFHNLFQYMFVIGKCTSQIKSIVHSYIACVPLSAKYVYGQWGIVKWY